MTTEVQEKELEQEFIKEQLGIDHKDSAETHDFR
jgi:hypothetical protein